MLGSDTNILIRAFLEDDEDQAQSAKAFLESAARRDQLFISSYTLLEFVWVLKVKEFTRKEIYEAIITLTDSPGVTIGQRDVVLAAAEMFYKGKADFGDYMILSEGEKYGAKNLKTFDHALLGELHHASLP
ncbi:MAG: putative nucleic-acid-binding protein [Alphaproteobacteria bacterium]|jgi:predicted nucleic-acid-binding protein|nr:putative nucleic-acid-binding protein [Alphaproteobacteria bacterium]